MTRAAAVLLVLLAMGCVTRGTHREVVVERDTLAEERDRLAERVRLLEASNTSLSAERIRLLDELEDLRQEQGQLESSVKALRREQVALEQSLKEREATLSELSRLKSTYEALVTDLETEVAAGQIEIEQLREGLRLNVSDEILFPSGSSELSAQGREVLQRVARQLVEIQHYVEVQGHTDDVPIRGVLAQRFPSNWELAGARAARVVRLLEGEGVQPRRLSAVSLGEHHPVAPNTDPQQRARNRRIEIRLIPAPEEAGGGADATPPTGAASPPTP